MMKSPPPAAFEMVEAQFVLQFLVVAFDAPPHHGELDQGCAGRRGGQRRQPILDRRRFGPGPLDQQPLFRPGGSIASRRDARAAPESRESASASGPACRGTTSPCAREARYLVTVSRFEGVESAASMIA